ncbi:hypothetical protein E1265_15885 [Streptomyces sp. 8K308]|nr:hypothetical protein E1265_15885 [Streptomyces sp. 8K308]
MARRGVEQGAAAHARYGDQLTVLWSDAHPDVYSPRTLPSGACHGMVVRALLGDGPAGLTPRAAITAGSGRVTRPSTSTSRRRDCAGRASRTWKRRSKVLAVPSTCTWISMCWSPRCSARPATPSRTACGHPLPRGTPVAD